MPDVTPEERAAKLAEGLARMLADPKSTKRPSPHMPAGHSGLNRRLGHLSPETAKHYRQRRDGALVRATPKPPARKPKRAKVFKPPAAPRRPAAEAMLAASLRDVQQRGAIRNAIRELKIESRRALQKDDLVAICVITLLPLSVVRDFAGAGRG